MTYEELKPLLEWRAGLGRSGRGPWTGSLLALALSVEDMVETPVPAELETALVGFRRRTKDGRYAVCRRFLYERAKLKPPSLRGELEDLLPADCLTCGWGQPGPHAAGCKLASILGRLDGLEAKMRRASDLVQRLRGAGL